MSNQKKFQIFFALFMFPKSHTFSSILKLSHSSSYYIILSHTLSYFLMFYHAFSYSLILSNIFSHAGKVDEVNKKQEKFHKNFVDINDISGQKSEPIQ